MGALRYNSGKLEWSLVSWKSIGMMVEVLMYGKHKYSTFEDANGKVILGSEISPDAAKKLKLLTSGADNWKEGMKWTKCTESLLRHTYAFLGGEDVDGESKINHLGHIMCNAMFLGWLFIFRKDLDDRTKDENYEFKQPLEKE